MWQEVQSSSVCKFLEPAITASLPGPNVLNAPFSKTHGPFLTLNVADQVSQT